MRYCKHSEWLTLSVTNNETNLEISNREQVLLYNLPDLDTQKPSLIVLIGNTAKAKALRELVSIYQGKFSSRRTHGEIHLHIDASSAFGDRPVLIADGDLPAYIKTKRLTSPQNCYKTTIRALLRVRGSLTAKNI